MDTKILRQKILDLAIRGKLVPQDPNDEPASVLLERIRAEKERLIAEGKIKRPKKSKASSSESHYQKFEPPFEIPDSWEWVTLDDLAFYKKGPFGSSLTKSMFVPHSEKTYKVYEQKNAIQKDANLGHYYIDEAKFNELKGFEAISGDIIVSCAGTIGESYVLPENSEKGIINQALMIVRLYNSQIQDFYLTYFDFVLKATAANAGKGTAIKNIPPFEILKAFPFPLPPLGEQKRIIYAIQIIEGSIHKFEFAKKSLGELIIKTKSKILELAMQGKLVPQDPTDESAADMLRRINPKAKIITDNPHYPLWCSTTLGDICGFERGITFPSDAKSFCHQKENVACLRTANVHDEVDLTSLWYINKLYLKGNDAKFLRVGDILMSTANSKELVGRSVLIRELHEDMTFGGFVTVIRTSISPKYLHLFLKYKATTGEFSKIATQTTNIANLNTKILSTVEIPLPPLNEQKRIVAKIEELYVVLDEIETSLQA